MSGGTRRRAALFIILGVTIGVVITGMALANAGSAPAGGYVSITPFKAFGGTIGAGKSVSALAIGGATTVPTDASAVRLSVTVKATKAGDLHAYPAGNPSAPAAATMSFPVGTTTNTVDETVGTKSQITFNNASAATVTVTVMITGYSTQITADDIAPDGGSSGQVLANTGSGTAWQSTGYVTSMANWSFGGGANPTGAWAFVGSPKVVHFADTKTAAHLSATLDFASSDGSVILSLFGVCYGPAATTVPTNAVDHVAPQFQASAYSFFAQTVTGVVGNLPAGDYKVGPCAQQESANVVHGIGQATMIVAQTTSGVQSQSQSSSPPAHGNLP